MPEILLRYYEGIMNSLRGDATINGLFEHQGLKGNGNEAILRELLQKYLPRKYGVGSGVVVDHLGNQSKQCDLIIYDAVQYPALLSLSNVHFFPVETVYATIEVKTTLNSREAQKALDNIASVRSLDFISVTFPVPTTGFFPLPPITSSPPLGFIFAYRSETQSLKTFRGWFSESSFSSPTLIGCLDFGLIYLQSQNGRMVVEPPIENSSFQDMMFPLYDASANNEPIVVETSEQTYLKENTVYPVKLYNGKAYPIDHPRILLAYMLLLHKNLSAKRLFPDLDFIQNYFDPNTPLLRGFVLRDVK